MSPRLRISIVRGVGVSLGIYAAAPFSGAHLNPAITVTAAVYDGFPWSRVLPYAGAQTAGAAGSELSAMMFGEYFPNPALFGTAEEAWRIVSPAGAFLAEMAGTAMLAFLIGAATREGNPLRPSPRTAPLVIGLGLAAIISVIAPLTQAGLNPARGRG